jgi:predicted lactoylglutathione lyase
MRFVEATKLRRCLTGHLLFASISDVNFFANFPVADLDRSKAFFTALGWSLNEAVSDDNAACFTLGDGVSLMALRRDFYASLGDGSKEVGDPATTSLVTFAFDFPTRADVVAFVEKAEAAGAKLGGTDDYGFMYQRQFDDPDGNHFAPFWMDPDGPSAG